MEVSLDNVLIYLEAAVRMCGDIASKMDPGTPIGAEDKDEQLGHHFSTRADRESQARGLHLLSEYFPGEIIIAEEQENQTAIPPDCIVFDPLDGTTNYFNGIRDWGVTLCMLRDGRPYASATYFSDGEIISAMRGECTRIRYARTTVRSIPWHGMLDKTEVGTDIGSWTHKVGTFEGVLKPLSQRFNVLSSMAAVEGGRRVLLGQLGAYYNIGIAKIWDAAAMALAVEAAGGVVCAPDGSPVKWDNIRCDWIMAANQTLADAVLEHTRVWATVH